MSALLKKPPMWALQPALVAPEWGWFTNNWLSAFVAPNEGDGRVFDFAQRRLLSISGSVSSVITERQGRAIRFNDGATTDNTGLVINNGPVLAGKSQFTILTYIRWHGLNPDLVNENTVYDEWNTDQLAVLLRYDPTNVVNKFEGFVRDSGGTKSVVSDLFEEGYFETNEWFSIVFRHDGAQINIIVDGQVSSNPTTCGAVSSNSPTEVTWAKHQAGTGDGGALDFYIGAVLDYSATDVEIRQWSRDPFGPFRMADEAGVVFAIGGPFISDYRFRQRFFG